MKRELNQVLLTINGVGIRLAYSVFVGLISLDGWETPPNGVLGLRTYWRLNFCMYEDSTPTIAKSLNINLN